MLFFLLFNPRLVSPILELCIDSTIQYELFCQRILLLSLDIMFLRFIPVMYISNCFPFLLNSIPLYEYVNCFSS